MAVADDIKSKLAELDSETTAIAGLITNLASRITNSMSDQDRSDIQTALSAISTRLTSLAVDPTVPVPPLTPQMTAVKAKFAAKNP